MLWRVCGAAAKRLNLYSNLFSKLYTSKFGIKFNILAISMPNLGIMNMFYVKLFGNQLARIGQVGKLNLKGFEPAGNYSFSMTAVRIRLQTHEAQPCVGRLKHSHSISLTIKLPIVS
jgi:hypothetical protein